MKAPAGVITRSLLVRTTYFDSEPQPETHAKREDGALAEEGNGEGNGEGIGTAVGGLVHPVINLPAVSSAIAQTDTYLRLAFLLSDPSWSGEQAWPLPDPYRHTRRWGLLRDRYVEIVSVEMQSPLLILLGLSTTVVPRLGIGLVLLGERISAFGPRVSRVRKEELLNAAIYDKEMESILHGRADAFALQLMGDGYTAPRGPSRIDFLDPDSPDDEDLDDLLA
jgi:hypothetical protein